MEKWHIEKKNYKKGLDKMKKYRKEQQRQTNY